VEAATLRVCEGVATAKETAAHIYETVQTAKAMRRSGDAV